MASLRFRLCFLVFCVSNSIIIPTCCLGEICLPTNHAALFVFGDSPFDVGNNNYINSVFQANNTPYGETFFKYPTGRFSDGRLLPDFIAEYAELPFMQPYLYPGHQQYINGVNFASAGAGALVETHQGQELYKKGGSRFGVRNVGPLGCYPTMRGLKGGAEGDCFKEATEIVKLHNRALSMMLVKIEKELEGFKF